MKLTIFLVALASASAAETLQLDDSSSAAPDSDAQATGFEGFGGFGGFRGFHQFNGLMSNAFGDLEGQFDSSGFNKEFSGSKNRKFDTGYGQYFLEDLGDSPFGSDLGSPTTHQKQGHLAPAVQLVAKAPGRQGAVPRYHQPLPTTKYGQHSQLVQPAVGRKPYPAVKHTKALSPYNVQPYQIPYAGGLPRKHIADSIVPTYSGKSLVPQPFGTRKFTKVVEKTHAIRQESPNLKHFTENYTPDEGFAFGGEKLY